MTLAELKLRLNIPEDDFQDDEKLDLYLGSAIAYVKAYCNDQFEDGIPEDVKTAVAHLVMMTRATSLDYADGMNGISSANIGGVISYNKGGTSGASSYGKSMFAVVQEMLEPHVRQRRKVTFTPTRARC